jgi:hypothetical protein
LVSLGKILRVERERKNSAVYDATHHIHMFRSAPAHLFRGARLSADYEEQYSGSGDTPTSIDPIVATLFAAHEQSKGKAFVLILDKEVFRGMRGGPSIRTQASLELAVNLSLPPTEVERRATKVLAANDSIEILAGMGFWLPKMLYTPTQLQEELEKTPRLCLDDIREYSRLALGGNS